MVYRTTKNNFIELASYGCLYIVPLGSCGTYRALESSRPPLLAFTKCPNIASFILPFIVREQAISKNPKDVNTNDQVG